MNVAIQEQLQHEKPILVQATIGQDDITHSLQTLYGEDKCWNHRVIYFKDFLTTKDVGKDLRVKWCRKSGRVDCVWIRIRDLDAVFHGDVFHSYSENLKSSIPSS